MTKFALSSFSAQRHFPGIIILLLTCIALYAFWGKLSRITQDTPDAVYAVDFIAYYAAAQLVRSGNAPAIYAEMTDDFSVVDRGMFFETAGKAGFHGTPTRYVYLPVFLLPFSWLTGFSFATASLVWLWVNLAALAAILLLQWHITRDFAHPFLRLAAIMALNLFSFPLLYGLQLGQTSLLMYLAVCLIYCFFASGRDTLAGIALGLITALKFTPLLFVLYFLYRKKYRLALSAMATALSLLVLSIALYGLALHQLYRNYLGTISGMGIAAWSNQSIEALLLRIFHPAGIFNFAPLQITTFGTLLRYAIALAVIGTVHRIFRHTPDQKGVTAYPLEFSALILCFLILPPISWLHYLSLVNLAIILMWIFCFRQSRSRSALVIPLTLTGYGMIAFHPDFSALTALFGQGYVTKLLASLPLMGTCLLLCINLASAKQHHAHHGQHL
jgi:hypothetical protein